ncbi:MAG: glycerate kinase [Cyanobacteria bacterium P01_E01_bin.35]
MNQVNGDSKLNSLLAEGKESEFYAQLLGEVTAICLSLGIIDEQRIEHNFAKLWLPLALNLAQASQELERTFIQGVLGGQGTGKTTLCIILKLILNDLGFSVATLSIDDLYLTYEERQALQAKNSQLIWRGPPGTHNIEDGIRVINQCLKQDDLVEIALPRFDKSQHSGAGDRIEPQIVPKPDILLFEGWFVGVRPIAESFFDNPPAPIITAEDKQFAVDCNRRLQAYLPLWDQLDSLVILYPEDYRLSLEWRNRAEQIMIATKGTGMTDEEISRFVEYFWKALHPDLFIKPLTKTADMVVEIKSDRSLGEIYNPHN